MPITVICPTCQTTQHLDEMFAGKAIACSRCHSRIEVPLAEEPFEPVTNNPLLERVVGHRPPLALDILGIDLRWSSDFSVRDAFGLAWSLRHIFIFFLAFILFLHFNSSDASTAATAAPIFFFLGLILLPFSWLQANRIGRKEAPAPTPEALSKFLFPILFVFGDVRPALPAIRTFFLALILILSGLQFASDSGDMRSLVPLPSFNFTRAPANRAYRPPETKAPEETPATSAPAPKATTPDDLPLPPPDDPDAPPAK